MPTSPDLTDIREMGRDPREDVSMEKRQQFAPVDQIDPRRNRGDLRLPGRIRPVAIGGRGGYSKARGARRHRPLLPAPPLPDADRTNYQSAPYRDERTPGGPSRSAKRDAKGSVALGPSASRTISCKAGSEDESSSLVLCPDVSRISSTPACQGM